MATLKDVAQRACVDVSTVSRALNNTSYVHPETKARIVAAAKELGYRPNVMAKALRQGRRHTLGVIVPRLHLTLFSEILPGIEHEAERLGYSTLISTTDDDPQRESPHAPVHPVPLYINGAGDHLNQYKQRRRRQMPTASFCVFCYLHPTMMSMISRFVSFMPCLPRRPTFRSEFSTPLATMPSPPRNC